MKLLQVITYLLKINLFLVILFCSNKNFARKSDYSLLDKPITINYSVENKNFQMNTYLANKGQRAHSLYLRIIRKVYDQQFLKYGLKLTPNEKDKITELIFNSYSPNMQKMYLKALQSTVEGYKDVYKISLFMQNQSLDPNNAYAQYIKNNKTKLSKKQWEKLFSIASPDWIQKFIKATRGKQIKLLQQDNLSIFSLQIFLLYEKILVACQQNKINAEKKWNKEINALTIKVPDEYLDVRKKVQQTLNSSFKQMIKISIDSKLKLPYEKLKKYVNKHDNKGNN